MKKKILFLFIILTSFLIITGCGKSEVKEEIGDTKEDVVTRIGNMKYTEPQDYRNTNHKMDNLSYQTKMYKYFDFSIELTYRKNKNINDLKLNLNKYEQVEINKVKYRFVEDGGGGTTFDSYYVQYNKGAYIVEFYGNKTEDNFKVMETLLNSIEFVED